MKILSYNIRGLGGRVKKEEVRGLIGKFCPDFVCLQETKYCDHMSFNPLSIWGSNVNAGWAAKDAIGQSGGIWSSWG